MSPLREAYGLRAPEGLTERVLDGPLEGLLNPILAAGIIVNTNLQITDADRKCSPVNRAGDGSNSASNLSVGAGDHVCRATLAARNLDVAWTSNI